MHSSPMLISRSNRSSRLMLIPATASVPVAAEEEEASAAVEGSVDAAEEEEASVAAEGSIDEASGEAIEGAG